jgi:hypothetical protein
MGRPGIIMGRGNIGGKNICGGRIGNCGACAGGGDCTGTGRRPLGATAGVVFGGIGKLSELPAGIAEDDKLTMIGLLSN